MKSELLALLLSGMMVAADPVTTVFTYHGILNESGAVANGTFDFEFRLYDALAGGSLVGGVQNADNLPVNAGLFAAELNFGDVFDGNRRWLEIAVRSGATTSAYSTMSPRSQLTAVPHALWARQSGKAVSAAIADQVGWSDIVSVPADFADGTDNDTTYSAGTGLNLSGNKFSLGTVPLDRLSPAGAIPGQSIKFDGINWSPADDEVGPSYGAGLGMMLSGDTFGLVFAGSGFSDTVARSDHHHDEAYTPLSHNHDFVYAPLAHNHDGTYAAVGHVHSAGEITSGVLADDRIDPALARLTQVMPIVFSNDGPGSGLDADTLDGLDSTAFAVADHTHEGSFWTMNGNAGTDPSLNFVGTTDNQPLEFRVNNSRGLRLEPGGSNSVNVIGGWTGNSVGAGVAGATVGGGGAGDWFGVRIGNRVDANLATVSGGLGNIIQSGAVMATIGGGWINTVYTNSEYATIAGGVGNAIQTEANYATIGGGYGNAIQTNADYSTIAAGAQNTVGRQAFSATVGGGGNNFVGAGAHAATIGGGAGNVIQTSGYSATIPGGENNRAGAYAFAAGTQAKADHAGAFVWADASGRDLVSTGINTVTMRASGGYRLYSSDLATSGTYLAAGSGSWTSVSDRNAKEDFAEVDSRKVLDKVAALPVQTWKYKTQDASVRHIGPTAQDFKAAFGVGESENGITGVDADGVALAAIQGLNQKLEEQQVQLQARDQEIQTLQHSMSELKTLINRLITERTR